MHSFNIFFILFRQRIGADYFGFMPESQQPFAGFEDDRFGSSPIASEKPSRDLRYPHFTLAL